VALVGGSRLLRAGLRLLLERQPDLRIVGDGETFRELGGGANNADCDVVILDADDAADPALETIARTQREVTPARVLVIATRCDSATSQRIVLAGAGGVVLKDSSPGHLMQAIRKVAEGELWIDRATIAVLISGMASGGRGPMPDPERTKIASLTQRERQVIALIANGMSNKVIAANLKISDITVRHHLTSIFEKLGTHDRLALLVYAYRHKLALPQT
jgi:DNA-binding NarL/FixJ family response regulator